MTFHEQRYRDPQRSFRNLAWQFHDDHPLPPRLNAPLRHIVYLKRLAIHRYRQMERQWPSRRNPLNFVVPRDRFLEARDFPAPPLAQMASWFDRVHAANEAVYQGDGSWRPQPFSGYRGRGIPIEEIALRVPGYLAAFRATGRSVYLDRAGAAADYLLRERVFRDGHVLLQGHLTQDWGYTLAGTALLAMWEHDRDRTACLDAALATGEHLLDAPISGSVNHGTIPSQLFGPLYRHTGDARFLRAMHRRMRRRALAFQLPSGDWEGHEGRSWYQGVNLKSLIVAYTTTPFSLENTRMNDRLAGAVYAAANWFTALQDETGAIPLTRYGGDPPAQCANEVMTWDGSRFRQAPMAEGYLGHGAFEIDALVSLSEELDAADVLPVLHGYTRRLAATGRLWRLDYNTLGAGRALELATRLQGRTAGATQRAFAARALASVG